jgi:hypothetical protein
MSNSNIPLYRLEMTACSGTVFTPSKWPVEGFARNGDGDPHWAELNDFIRTFEESLKARSDHEQFGLDSVGTARIIRQSDGEIMVHWNRRA